MTPSFPKLANPTKKKTDTLGIFHLRQWWEMGCACVSIFPKSGLQFRIT